MVSLPDSVLQRERTQNLRLSAPALFLPSGVLRQPHLSPARRTGSSVPATPGCQPHHRPAQQDHHHLRAVRSPSSTRESFKPSSKTSSCPIPSFVLTTHTAPSNSTCVITCACAPSRLLRSHRCRQHFHHRRALSLCVGCSSNFSHQIHSGFASIRSTQTQSQGLGRKTPKIAPLSTPSTGLFHLPCIPQTLRTRLLPAHCRLTPTLPA